MERYEFKPLKSRILLIQVSFSTGVPGKIHVSQQTADLLRSGGKGDWVSARSNLIVAKGKGEIQTYWLSVTDFRVVSDKDFSTTEVATVGKQEGERSERLVLWVTEGLKGLLKQIHDQRPRSDTFEPTPLPLVHSQLSKLPGTTVLEEVSEIIHMPPFKDEHELDGLGTDMDEQVLRQLEEYVASIAAMCKWNNGIQK